MGRFSFMFYEFCRGVGGVALWRLWLVSLGEF